MQGHNRRELPPSKWQVILKRIILCLTIPFLLYCVVYVLFSNFWIVLTFIFGGLFLVNWSEGK